ncbi:MAG: anaphase-promoting protein, partial [Leptospira sp.]|nr:anaphase-promoting protein [Leptospira sp.]
KQTEIYLTNAYKIDPKNKFALGALTVFYYDKGMYSESLKMVDQYLNFYPDDKNLKILRTDILAKQGNYKESLNELTELVKKDTGFLDFQSSVKKSLSGGDPEIKEHVENLAKKTKAKIHEFRTKLELSKENPDDFTPPDPQDAMDLSLLYLFQGDSEKAMKYLVYAKKANVESQDK